jgi:hypothetical protein
LLYGLNYVKEKEEKISANRGIVSTPNFLFYNNNTKVIIDFSDASNTTSKEELQNFWNLLVEGMTFSINDAEIVNSNAKPKNDLSGIYQFTNFEDSLIFADVVSIENISENLNLYNKTDFVALPNFIFNNIIEPVKTTPITNIVNNLGKNSKNSFSYLGIKVGDYIQIQAKQNKFEVIDYSIDSEGKEVVKVFGDITEENRTTSKTFIGLYIHKINESVIDVDITDEVIGSCQTIENGVVVSCTSNNTNSQCQLRQQGTNSVLFTANEECSVAEQEEFTNTDVLTQIVEQQNRLLAQLQLNVRTQPQLNISSLPFR